jgi:hypothetical protein
MPLTLLDLAKRQNSDQLVGLVEDVVTASPEFRVFPAKPQAGTTYNVTRRTGLPGGGFRSANQGVDPGKSKYKQEVKSMCFLDAHIEVDEAIVKGDDGTIGNVLAQEAAGQFREVMNIIGRQVWRGTSADAKGFLGLSTQVKDNLKLSTGSNKTSAYLVWLDSNYQGVHMPVGNHGAIEMGEWNLVRVLDDNDKPYYAWCSNISSFIGLSVVSEYSVYRINGIDNSNKLTDAAGAELWAKVPTARKDGQWRWFMNSQAGYYLQASRSAVGAQTADGGGNQAFAPVPTHLMGVPIIYTDNLLSDETVS